MPMATRAFTRILLLTGVLFSFFGARAQLTLVKDISPGTDNLGSFPENFLVINNVAYFRALTSSDGEELWRSDGTAAGTVMVKNIYHTHPLQDSNPEYLTELNGSLYFTAKDAEFETELWVSDGTDAGTRIVKDIYPGSAGGGNPE
jgi:trimeric autotransporter adhesin